MRKVLSIALGVLGGLNIFFFWTPIIPTMGIQALIIGGILCIAGFMLWPRSTQSRIQWGRLAALRNKGEVQPVKLDPLLPVKALRLAESEGGVLTLAKTAMALDIPLDLARAALDECARKGNVTIEIDEQSGMERWEFPEFQVKRKELD